MARIPATGIRVGARDREVFGRRFTPTRLPCRLRCAGLPISMSETTPPCELCSETGGTTLWRDDRLRVVFVAEPDYPGFCRVIWNAHVKEMTDLGWDDRRHIMAVVFEVELALRKALQPDKINLASLGNMTPHLHWHVIPRFRDDPHFPGTVWSERRRDAAQRAVPALQAQLRARLASDLGEGGR